ncbi:thiopeptide-type bacteriocin [Saccharopolyspora montiporae]|uniref:thiopeptide-type bacteriocin n=1 Tax=Saccharopolyspora montiporae TaxID=2781240 RepID=UPI001D1519A6
MRTAVPAIPPGPARGCEPPRAGGVSVRESAAIGETGASNGISFACGSCCGHDHRGSCAHCCATVPHPTAL